MPFARKNTPYWWISYTNASGQRTRESTGTTDFKEASALEAKRRYESHQQKTWSAEPARYYDEMMLGYLRETAGKKTHDRDIHAAKHLTKHFTGRILNNLTPQDINDYKRARRAQGVTNHKGQHIRPLADGTLIKELATLSAAINHARREWGWDIKNIVSGRTPKKPKSKLRWLTQAEYTALIDAAKQQKRAADYLPDLICLAVNTGMRKQELLNLEWNRVDLGNRLIYLRPDDSKSQTYRSVPINDTATQLLRSRWGRHNKWVFTHHIARSDTEQKINSVKRSFAAATHHAGLAGVTIHTLRHTCAAWLVQAGVPIRTVSDILGHTDVRTTMIYAHLSPENVHSGVARLDGIQCDQNVPTARETVPITANHSNKVTPQNV